LRYDVRVDHPWREGQVAILEREATLPAESISPRRARQLVREVLDGGTRRRTVYLAWMEAVGT
jgi:hypothetical protein